MFDEATVSALLLCDSYDTIFDNNTCYVKIIFDFKYFRHNNKIGYTISHLQVPASKTSKSCFR